MKSKLIYLLLVIYIIYITIMYDGLSPILFLLFLLVLPLLGSIMVCYLKKEIDFEMKVDLSYISKEDQANICMEIRNRGWLPIPFVQFVLVAENNNGIPEHTIKTKINGMVDAESTQSFTYQFQPEKCGRFQVSIKEFVILDYLCLVKKRVQVEKKLELTVLPKIHYVHVEMTRNTADFMMDGEEYSKVKSGDDPSELFDVRKYQVGDRQQKIHWKMTARMGELMVKEFSHPLGNKIVLFLDFRVIDKKQGFISDSFFEVALSLSYSMMLEQISHYVVWFHAVEGRIYRKNIQSESDLFQMLYVLYEAVPFVKDCSIVEYYKEVYGKESYCTGISLDMGLNLQIGNQKRIKIQKNTIKDILTKEILEL